MRAAAWLAASLIGAASLAAPARADEPPAGMVETGDALRHEASGVRFPKWLKGLRRNLSPGRTIVAIYAPSSPYRRLQDLHIGVAIGPAEPMDRAKLISTAKSDIGATAAPEMISEGSFAWPGHPDAVTFHGAYLVGKHRKSYWLAWDQGWNLFVTATTARGRAEKMDELSALVAAEVLGGATLSPPPASGQP